MMNIYFITPELYLLSGSRRPTGERNISEPNIHDWVRIGGYERTIIEKTTRKQSAPSIDMPPPR
ncbi:hypothetical protein H5410_056224 [Solanum commersonii]|uniref:Uncharacterized protein n=1 Tax=Solanum commersonii TaxID=4109 RepID=A0A9J5WKN7_SOLCO|nr:hypothetical protein H5410_056224 [Solanum commersonii]